MKLLQLHSRKQPRLVCVAVFLLFFIWKWTPLVLAGTLSCSITTSAACNQTTILRLSASLNAHAELPSQSNSNYDNTVVCCTNVIGLGNSCAGTTATVLKLSSTSNAHVQQNNLGSYTDNACISVPSGGSVTIGYQDNDCSGYDTTLASIASTSNAHVGGPGAYTRKVCATASGVPQTLSFSISDNSIGFGSLSAVQARYATGDTLGSTTDTIAHTISVATNAANGYSMTLDGATLTYGAKTITAIGASANTSSPGSEQFGLRLSINSGTGAASAPYNTSNWAFDTLSFPDIVATGSGDSVTTVFEAHYIANTATLTESGNYTTALTYTVTAAF